MFPPFANFDVESINHLILLVNPIEIRRKVQAKSALDFTFQGIIRSATIAAGFLVPEAPQVRQTARPLPFPLSRSSRCTP
jgi:hypothetical protein